MTYCGDHFAKHARIVIMCTPETNMPIMRQLKKRTAVAWINRGIYNT